MRISFGRLLGFLSIAGALIVLPGCGKSDGRLQVTGTVKYEDGTVPKGATSGVVRFDPEDPNLPNVRPAMGYINGETGEFELYSVKPGDGATPGSYKVSLIINRDYPPKPQGSLVPLDYASAESTPLIKQIDSANRHFDLVVPKRDPKKDSGKKR